MASEGVQYFILDIFHVCIPQTSTFSLDEVGHDWPISYKDLENFYNSMMK